MKREFVSYPKSGRTWIRFMLVEIGCEKSIRFHHDRFEFNDGSRPPHDFDVQTRLGRYGADDKVVYLERDPRDVMVSLYHQITGRFRDFFAYDGTLSEFLRDDYFGARNLHRFRRMWSDIATRNRFLKITYEDCHRDAAGVLEQVLDYYGIGAGRESVERAAASSSFERMKEIEQQNLFPEPWLRQRNRSPKVRKGMAGGHGSELAPDDLRYLNSIFGAALTE
jgi:hypothetical protein